MRVAIITGAAQGLGRATAERFLASGHSVMAVDRSAGGLETLARLSPAVRTLEVDVSDKAAADKTVQATLGEFGRIDVLVNNAGIGHARSILDTSDEDLDRYLAINLAAPFRFARAVIPKLKAGAAIVNISSIFGLVGYPRVAPYAATKAGVAGLTRQLAADYGPLGIRVNAVAPGLVRTPLNEERVENDPIFKVLQIQRTPFPRIGRPSDIASAVHFLCSEEAGFINGQVLAVDGGWSTIHQIVESGTELH